MITSESITAIAPALLKAQMAMTAAAKSATNPHFKSKYSDLATVIDAVKGPLNANGILFMQSARNTNEGVYVATRLQHESGEYMEETIFLPVPQQTPQAYGSAITYAKRYQLQSMNGLPSEDDDGQAASAAKPQPPVAQMVAAETPLSDEEMDFLRSHADKLKAMPIKGVGAYITGQHLDNDEKVHLWTMLPANIRSAIKKQTQPALATQG